MIDVIPLSYNVAVDDILNWSADDALRRFHLAKAKLGIKQ